MEIVQHFGSILTEKMIGTNTSIISPGFTGQHHTLWNLKADNLICELMQELQSKYFLKNVQIISKLCRSAAPAKMVVCHSF
jgi:hypothetical protein